MTGATDRVNHKMLIGLILWGLCGGVSNADVLKAIFPFYVYSDYGAVGKRHFEPSGKMGASSDLGIVENWRESPAQGKSCIRMQYTPEEGNQKWAGLYWLYPANNWGMIPDIGFDLTNAKRLVFFARGEKGKELVTFRLGGVQARYGDSFSIETREFQMTKKWQEYAIDVENKRKHHVIGGFCVIFSSESNPTGATIYLDEIRYES